MSGLVGIMADSHGDLSALERGVALLENLGCFPLYHLGDICDSTRPDTVEPCLSFISKHDVLSVKGNNEHSVLVGFSEGGSPVLTDACASFLKEMPLVRRAGDAMFAHSLPFERELGLSSMVRAMGGPEAKAFFERFPKSILFRGHSHVPAVLEPGRGDTVKSTLRPGDFVSLCNRRPLVVTCGALTDGFCMAWDTGEDRLLCLSFIL